jgi:hypothetical protein
MKTPREPVNKQAAMSLSNGTGKIETVEEALQVLASIIAGDRFAKNVRQVIETGVNVKYEIKISKRQAHGFTARLNTTILDPERQLAAFVGLE